MHELRIVLNCRCCMVYRYGRFAATIFSIHWYLQAIDAEVERQRKLDDAKNSMKIISPSESSDESDDEESSTVKM